MRTQDGRIIKAVSKEKEEARKEHDAAIQKGKMTGLVEHVSEDIFSISLGALPASQVITTTVTYVMDLMDADLKDEIRFQLPACVGMRYGSPPEGMACPLVASGRINIIANIRMKGPIRSITSPTHTLSGSQSLIKYHSDSFLHGDFVLLIKADGLDESRCFAERHLTGTVAMQLTMIPKFSLPPIPSQEYIFLVDRSGSMAADRIKTAKDALVMLLRALPGKGTTFNIFSFGNRCDSLFNESVPYTQTNMADATIHIDRMSNNYGGTEVAGALTKVFGSRSGDIPTACFILTDGQAYDLNGTLNLVKEAVAEATEDAPLRVFTLGIGDSASTAMCEGLARVGNGICLMAVTSESIIAKSAKLVRASRTPTLKDISIEWETKPEASSNVTSQAELCRQAPMNIPSLYPGVRLVVFTLLKYRDIVIPDEITLCARAPNSDHKEVLFRISVDEPLHPVDESEPHLIHTLAARKIIQDLDDADRGVDASNIKWEIVHLGEQYQLASRYTSFIAVDDSGIVGPEPAQQPSNQPEIPFMGHSPFAGKRARRVLAITPPPPAVEETSDVEIEGVPIAYDDDDDDEWEDAGIENASVSVPISLHQFCAGSEESYESSESDEDEDDAPRPKRARTVRTDSDDALASHAPADSLHQPSIESNEAVHSGNVTENVIRLVRLQSFDGSFAATVDLKKIVGPNILSEAESLDIDMIVWATVLAVAYLQKYMQDQPELLESLVEKAVEFVVEAAVVDLEHLLAAARKLLG